MYRITLYTSQWEFYFIADVTTLPTDEFVEAKNWLWQVCYVNRNAILFYKIIKKRW
jgi:hypothetical protein